MRDRGVLATVKHLEGLGVQRRNLVKADDDLLDGFRLDEASDSRVTASAQRLVLGVVEDLVDESLQYEMELIISNLGDCLTKCQIAQVKLWESRTVRQLLVAVEFWSMSRGDLPLCIRVSKVS